MPSFAILMREDDDAWERLPAAEQEAISARYQAWVEELKRTSVFQGGTALGSPGTVLRRAAGKVAEAPFAETKQVLTGWLLVTAKDLPDAVRIARGCPALLHGETVIVRPAGGA